MDRPDIGIAEALIGQYEGWRLSPYQDSAGIWTIGAGCTTLADGSRVTAETPPLADMGAARDLLSVHLAGVVEDVRHLVRVTLVDHQWGALYSFAFNIGCSAFAGSTVLHLVNQPAFAAEVAPHFGSWVYAHDPVTHRMVVVPGLVTRRKGEAACWMGAAVPKVVAI